MSFALVAVLFDGYVAMAVNDDVFTLAGGRRGPHREGAAPTEGDPQPSPQPLRVALDLGRCPGVRSALQLVRGDKPLN